VAGARVSGGGRTPNLNDKITSGAMWTILQRRKKTTEKRSQLRQTTQFLSARSRGGGALEETSSKGREDRKPADCSGVARGERRGEDVVNAAGSA